MEQFQNQREEYVFDQLKEVQILKNIDDVCNECLGHMQDLM